MKWISIKDKLPPEKQVRTKRIVFTDSQEMRFANYSFNPNSEKMEWMIWDYGDYDDIGDAQVTHWMKLPEPPNEY